MKIVFCGPSLRLSDVPEGWHLRPPAEQGDIASVSMQHPGAVLVVVDGYFRQALAPWHKEILFAIQVQGCRVIGAGSLGAIRAVECEAYGAEPVGVIAGWYRSGVVVDDGDVAVAHGNASAAYEARTVPLVNLRASGVCDEDLARMAKIPFEARTWEGMGAVMGISWVEDVRGRYVDQKRLDALEALRVADTAPVVRDRVLAMNLDTALFRCLLGTDLPRWGVREFERVSMQERVDGDKERMLLHMADALGVVAPVRDVERAAKNMWARLGVPDEAGSLAWLEANKVSMDEWWSRARDEATISALLDWQLVWEAGAESVPRALARRKFYKQ